MFESGFPVFSFVLGLMVSGFGGLICLHNALVLGWMPVFNFGVCLVFVLCGSWVFLGAASEVS